MRIHLQQALAALALFTIGSNRVRAEGFEHIRPQSSLLKAAIATAFDSSPTFRSIVERIEASDVIAHVTCGYFKSSLVAGRTMLAAAGPDVRYVRVQILCDQPPPGLVAIVAHELQHVAEIASAPAVIDDSSFGRLYRKIGFATCLSPSPDQFETPAAMLAGQRVRTEVRRHSESGVTVRPRVDRAGQLPTGH
jgi:hypothetical protein